MSQPTASGTTLFSGGASNYIAIQTVLNADGFPYIALGTNATSQAGIGLWIDTAGLESTPISVGPYGTLQYLSDGNRAQFLIDNWQNNFDGLAIRPQNAVSNQFNAIIVNDVNSNLLFAVSANGTVSAAQWSGVNTNQYIGAGTVSLTTNAGVVTITGGVGAGGNANTNVAQQWTATQTFTVPQIFTNLGAGSSTVIASNVVTAGTVIATNFTSLQGGQFTGNGAGLTNLNAANLTGSLSGTISGNGSGLTNLNVNLWSAAGGLASVTLSSAGAKYEYPFEMNNNLSGNSYSKAMNPIGPGMHAITNLTASLVDGSGNAFIANTNLFFLLETNAGRNSVTWSAATGWLQFSGDGTTTTTNWVISVPLTVYADISLVISNASVNSQQPYYSWVFSGY